jgi:glyoxylase-like metal-dependent hydrolase (beta-lactamase superfamily II)/rhodanese-related sulfurtransferase
MILEQLGPAACRTYLMGCEHARRAILVDPVAELCDPVAKLLDERGLTLDLVVDTHTHADHHSGGREVARRSGAPYALHQATECEGVDERLRDGQVLEVGNERVEILHTPGHTPDSVTLRCGRNLLTGDFLFLAQDGAGRLDLPGGDPAAHWDSLGRLASYDDEHRVWPGHDYAELTDSTLGEERRRNPRFQRITREEYVAWQKAIAAPTPQWMLDVIASNLGSAAAHAEHHTAAHELDAGLAAGLDPVLGAACADGGAGGGGACSSGPMGRVPMLFPDEVARRLSAPDSERPYLLDVREPWEFSGPMGRHAPGAVLIPLGQLPGRLEELPRNPDRELHVICKTGGRSARAVELLIDRGWRRVFNVATGTEGWVREGLPTEN